MQTSARPGLACETWPHAACLSETARSSSHGFGLVVCRRRATHHGAVAGPDGMVARVPRAGQPDDPPDAQDPLGHDTDAPGCWLPSAARRLGGGPAAAALMAGEDRTVRRRGGRVGKPRLTHRLALRPSEPVAACQVETGASTSLTSLFDPLSAQSRFVMWMEKIVGPKCGCRPES